MAANGLLFDDLYEPVIAVSYGMGWNSTAMLVGLSERGIRPTVILFADTGGEKDETYAYLPVIQGWLDSVGFPRVIVVRYVPRRFKNFPPYYTLEDNCLTNGTLPSLAFGFKSCSLKWKVAPQDAFMSAFRPALEAWSLGLRVRKMIGYDAGPKDAKRYAHSRHGAPDRRYEYAYPLMEWGWDRKRCAEAILDAGLPLPPKSSCFFCPAMQPEEVRALSPAHLRRIVKLEARAKPRLKAIEGLWRNGSSGKRNGSEPKPGSISKFIRDNELLPGSEIDSIEQNVCGEIIEYQEGFAAAKAVGKTEVYEFEHSDEDYREHDGI